MNMRDVAEQCRRDLEVAKYVQQVWDLNYVPLYVRDNKSSLVCHNLEAQFRRVGITDVTVTRSGLYYAAVYTLDAFGKPTTFDCPIGALFEVLQEMEDGEGWTGGKLWDMLCEWDCTGVGSST